MSNAAISGNVFNDPLKVDLFVDGRVDYENVTVDLPNPFSDEPADLGSGTVVLGTEGQNRLTLLDTDRDFSNSGIAGPNPGNFNEQIILVDGLVDLIIQPLKQKDFNFRSNVSENTTRGFAEGLIRAEEADLFAPTISGTVRSDILLDGQLDLDAIFQTVADLTVKGVLSGGLATLKELPELLSDGFTDFLEIGAVDTLLGFAGEAGDLIQDFLDTLPATVDGELVVFDVTKNLGLRLEQDVTFDPSVTYTVTYGDVVKTADITEEVTFTDAELDALPDGATPTIEFFFEGDYEAVQRIVSTLSTAVTAGQGKFQINAPTFKFGVPLPVQSTYNFASDALFSENYPTDAAAQSLNHGIVIDRQVKTISLSTGALEIPYVVIPETITRVVTPPPGDPLVVRRDNLIEDVTIRATGDFSDPASLTGGRITLGSGQDTLSGASGSFVDLGAGDDLVEAFQGTSKSSFDMRFDAGDGNDIVALDALKSGAVAHGGAGDDTFTISGNSQSGDFVPDARLGVLHGDDGNDVLTATQATLEIDGGLGNDVLTGESFSKLIRGAGDDLITLGELDYSRDNAIQFFRQDFLDAVDRGARSEALGGAGNDRIQDSLFLARDPLTGRSYIAESNDNLSGGQDNDVITAGAGEDTLDGGNGNDLLTKLHGEVTLRGGDGDDTILIGNGQGLTPETLISSTRISSNAAAW